MNALFLRNQWAVVMLSEFRKQRYFYLELTVCVLALVLFLGMRNSHQAAAVLATAFEMGQFKAEQRIIEISNGFLLGLVPNILVIVGRRHWALALMIWGSVHGVIAYNLLVNEMSFREMMRYDPYFSGAILLMLPLFYLFSFLRSETYGLLASRWHNW